MTRLFIPTIATSTGYNIYFNNAFYYPHSGHNAIAGGVIGSSGFYVGAETTESFFDDDGTGDLRRYHFVGIVRTYDDTAAGTVNYTTGSITVNALSIGIENKDPATAPTNPCKERDLIELGLS